jgi:hypothetical protein
MARATRRRLAAAPEPRDLTASFFNLGRVGKTVAIPLSRAPSAPPVDPKVSWRPNQLRRAARGSALFSLAMSAGLLAITLVSIALGDRSLISVLALVFSFFLIDGAATRLLSAARAPLAIGFSDFALHIRMPQGDHSVAWTSISDMRFTSIAPRADTLTVTKTDASIVQYSGVASAIASEAKLAWLEASARAHAKNRGAARLPGVARIVAGYEDLLPSAGPQYWIPLQPGDDAPLNATGPGAMPPAQTTALSRPSWGYTRGADGAQTPDPRYSSPASSVRPFVWHFIPSSGSRLGAGLLLAVLVLAGIAVTRIAADTLLSLAGQPSDPWVADLIGLAAGAALAGAVWWFARDELSGEVAGSVIFLPAFDRTKVELVSTLRDAGQALGVGDPMERRFRGRLVVLWRRARTRATILQASPETRAIVLRTVGRSNFEAHAKLKGAILDRLRGPGTRR